MMVDEIREHLTECIVPFWKRLRDDEFGGYYGYLGYDLELDKKAEKGCILNSRIMWFFSNASLVLGKEELLGEARHGFTFMKEHCFDKENGGIYWSLNYDGSPLDTTKHTYNQAFGIYALAAYYEASKEEEALGLAKTLFHVIEDKCRDDGGYLEAFTKDFKPESNEKLSENGVLAERTMNTFLHILEAYTELYRVSSDPCVKERMVWLLGLLEKKIYNPFLHRQEVFFDKKYTSLIDLHSFGHDIEAAWLINRAVEVIGERTLSGRIRKITADLVNQVYEEAYDGHSFANECEKGVVNEHRIWWVQAEAIVGFFDAYEKDTEKKEYLEASEHIWEFIKEHVIDRRKGSEWFWEVDQKGDPYPGRPIVEPWKCPYHNGRMCMEIVKRNQA